MGRALVRLAGPPWRRRALAVAVAVAGGRRCLNRLPPPPLPPPLPPPAVAAQPPPDLQIGDDLRPPLSPPVGKYFIPNFPQFSHVVSVALLRVGGLTYPPGGCAGYVDQSSRADCSTVG